MQASSTTENLLALHAHNQRPEQEAEPEVEAPVKRPSFQQKLN
jgi:hypothetical protein